MKRLGLGLVVVVAWFAMMACFYAMTVNAQAPDRLLPTEAYAFSYPDAAFANEAIDRFEVAYDSGAFTSIGIPTKVDTVNGVSRYKLIPPQTSGTHTFSLRACNVAGCSAGSVPFAFAPLSSATTVPGAITKVPR